MKILVDGRVLSSRVTGVERYIRELLAQFSRERVRGLNVVDVYLKSPVALELSGVGHRVEDATKPAVLSYDIYHRPFQPSDFASVVELAAAPASVLSIHDLIAYRHEDYWDDKESFRSYRQTLEFAAVAADRIITISQSTKREMLSSLAVEESKIDITYLGVNDQFRVVADSAAIDQVLAAYNLKSGYILSVGTDYPHKNRISLLRAFEQIAVERPELKLVLAGPKIFQRAQPEVDLLVRKLGSKVLELEDVPDEHLVALYNGACLYVFPSLDEGFGLPVLEAFACDIPVVCSNSASLPEAAGDAALLVDARNVAALSEAMRAALDDQNVRSELIERGRKRAREFTWERTARETWQSYERAVRQMPVQTGVRGTPDSGKPSQEPPRTFSIVICTRNRSRRLRQTLESIAGLKVDPPGTVDVVVVDNASEDDTSRVAEVAARSIGFPVTVVSEPALGISNARNRGIKEAKGDVIIFIDDDVELLPEFVIEYARAYKRWPQATCIGGKVELKWVVPRPGWLTDSLIGLLGLTLCPDEEREYHSPAFHIIGCNMSFRRSIFDDVGGFDISLGYTGTRLLGNEENDMLRRIEASGGTIVHSHLPLLFHLIERDKLSKSYFRDRYFYQAVTDAQNEISLTDGSNAQLIRLRKKEREIRSSLRRDALRKLIGAKLRFEDIIWLDYVGTRLKRFEEARATGVAVDEKKEETKDETKSETGRALIKQLSARLAESEATVAELTGSGSRMYKLVSEYYRLRRKLVRRA